MSVFSMEVIEKMSPGAASEIIVFHLNEEIKKICGGLDPLSVDLFKLNIPEFKIMKVINKLHPKESDLNSKIGIDILVKLPKDIGNARIGISMIYNPRNIGSGFTYSIIYSVYLMELNLNGLINRYISTLDITHTHTHTNSSLYIGTGGIIHIDPSYYKGITVEGYFIKFIKLLLIDKFLVERSEFFLREDSLDSEKYRFDAKQTHSLLKAYHELLKDKKWRNHKCQ